MIVQEKLQRLEKWFNRNYGWFFVNGNKSRDSSVVERQLHNLEGRRFDPSSRYKFNRQL